MIFRVNFHIFSALIEAVGKPRKPALLILLDMFQRTNAATEEEIILIVIPEEIRYKLAEVMETYDKINIHYMSDDYHGYM